MTSRLYWGGKSIELMLLFVSLKLKATLNWTINEFICSESLAKISIYYSHLFVYLETRHLNELTWILLWARYFHGALMLSLRKYSIKTHQRFWVSEYLENILQIFSKIFVPDVPCVERKLFWQGGLSVNSHWEYNQLFYFPLFLNSYKSNNMNILQTNLHSCSSWKVKVCHILLPILRLSLLNFFFFKL